MKWSILFLFLGVFWKYSSAIECHADPKDTEARIKHQLICANNYDKSHKDKNTTNVGTNFLIRSFDFNEDSILRLTLWVVMKWADPRLKWNPSAYDNMDEIYEETDYIWIPQLNLYNEEIDISKSNCADTTCILSSKGEVRCVFPCTYNGQCETDFVDWPYDKQTCSLTFGAWIHPGEHLNFTTKATTLKTDHSAYNYEWKMIGTWIEKSAGKFNNSRNNATYPSLNYSFFLERHSATFTAIVTVPAMLCAAANLTALLLDLFSTERFILICVNIVIHVMHLQLLVYNAPNNGDDAPKIVVFARDSLSLTGFLLIMTSLLRSMYRYRGVMPNWLTTTHNALSNASIYRVLVMNGAPAASVTSSSGNRIERIEEQHEDDGAVLVEMKKTETAYSNTESLWPTIALLVDRILLIVFFCAYLALILAWLPSQFTREDAMEKLGIDTDNE